MQSPFSLDPFLKEENKNFFAPCSLEIALLKDCPHVIPSLAKWMYDEWHRYDATLTQESLVKSLHERLNNDKIPLTFVLLKEGVPVGTISLKERPHDFLDFPENSLWMGNFVIIPEQTNLGLGKKLLSVVKNVAKLLGYQKIYFYTSNFDVVNWYVKNGAYILEERAFRNHIITMMEFSLKDID